MIIKLENQPSQVSEEGRHYGRVITAEPKIDEGPKFFESKIHSLTNTAVMNPFFIQQFVK